MGHKPSDRSSAVAERWGRLPPHECCEQGRTGARSNRTAHTSPQRGRSLDARTSTDGLAACRSLASKAKSGSSLEPKK
eukprot:6191496-Pleurochrysis_carterae.AAC.3